MDHWSLKCLAAKEIISSGSSEIFVVAVVWLLGLGSGSVLRAQV